MRRHGNGTAVLAFVLSDVASFDFGMLVRMSELDFQGERQGRSILNDSQLNGFTQTCPAVDVCGNRRHGMRSQQSLGNPKAVVRTLHHLAPCAVPTALQQDPLDPGACRKNTSAAFFPVFSGCGFLTPCVIEQRFSVWIMWSRTSVGATPKPPRFKRKEHQMLVQVVPKHLGLIPICILWNKSHAQGVSISEMAVCRLVTTVSLCKDASVLSKLVRFTPLCNTHLPPMNMGVRQEAYTKMSTPSVG